MNIVNMHYLDMNNYSEVLIGDKSITYKSDEDYLSETSCKKSSNRIKDLCDKDKISEVIDHFIENCKIMSIKFKDTYCERSCSTIGGSRILRSFAELSEEDWDKITDKFHTDRAKVLMAEDFDMVYITYSNIGSECYITDLNGYKTLVIKVYFKDGSLMSLERKFLDQAFKFLMNGHKGFCKQIHKKEDGKSILGTGFGGGRKDILCDMKLYVDMFNIWINNCNNVLKRETNYRQLKLEM